MCVSDIDIDIFRKMAPDARYELVANGTDIEYFTPLPSPEDSKRLIYAGGMSWYPNADAMEFFAEGISPLVEKDVPSVCLDVLGSHPPTRLVEIAKTKENIKIHGFVDDIREYMRQAAVYIVPIRVGGGTRLKILDAMACGKAVVSTSVGCEGLEVTPDENILIGNTPEEFARQVVRLLKDSTLRNRLELNGRRLVEQKYSWDIIGARLNGIYKSVVQQECDDMLRTEKPVVMHLIAAMDIAGSARVVLNLLAQQAISPCEQRVTSFVRASDGAGTTFLEMAQQAGTVVDQIKIYKRWDWGDVGAMVDIIKKHDVKLIHSHGYKSDIVGAFASLRTGVPMMATAHGFTAADANISRNEKIGRLFLRRAKKVICVSDNVRDSLVRSGIRANRLELIPNGIDFDHFSIDGNDTLRQEWGLGPNDTLIGTAGRMSPEKAQANMIKAIGRLDPAQKARVRIAVAGDGPLRDLLIETARDCGLAGQLILPGVLCDMRPFYNALDIFCLPSLTEGTPLTLLEAAASGKPVIASRVGSIAEIIDDSKNGLLVEPGDLNQLTDAIAQMVASPQLRDQFGIGLREKLLVDYDIKVCARKTFDIYREVLEQSYN